MAKKKDEKKVVELVPREVETPAELTEEQIEFIKQRDDAEIDKYLSKFDTINNVADSSEVEEEDEDEEETLTIDFDKGEAYSKEEKTITGEDLFKQIQEAIGAAKPRLQTKFGDLITERFVSKAIASLVGKLNKAIEGVEDAAEEELKHFGYADAFAEEASKPLYKKKEELRRAFYLGKIEYDKIPQWAESYIEEYIQNAINSMLDFTERD
jgi:hypothetical protein